MFSLLLLMGRGVTVQEAGDIGYDNVRGGCRGSLGPRAPERCVIVMLDVDGGVESQRRRRPQ